MQDYFDIEFYLNNFINNNIYKDKLGNILNKNDQIIYKDIFNKNYVYANIVKLYNKNNKPFIQIKRKTTVYENNKLDLQRDYYLDENILSILVLKN